MKNVEKIIRILAAIVGYGWLWGANWSEFMRERQPDGSWRTYHPAFDADDFDGKDIYTWPYGSRSEELFLANFPDEKITGSGETGNRRWISSRSKM